MDLDGYIHQFKQFLAREKPVAMRGDINQHHRYIQVLSTVQFPLPKEVPNLDRELNLIKKQAVLGLDEIYAVRPGLEGLAHELDRIDVEARELDRADAADHLHQ